MIVSRSVSSSFLNQKTRKSNGECREYVIDKHLAEKSSFILRNGSAPTSTLKFTKNIIKQYS
jgi:hypothetical protein